jgi:hypothetical protein
LSEPAEDWNSQTEFLEQPLTGEEKNYNRENEQKRVVTGTHDFSPDTLVELLLINYH